MNGIDLDRLLSRLREFDALRVDDTVNTGAVDRIQPALADQWPAELDSSVRDALIISGISQPYQHQADAIIKSLSGADVVMESPTASGKTLAFTAPMLHSLVRNEGSHALMIYPMKALAFDQRTQIEQLCEPLSIHSWPYDGDTHDDVKKMLRDQPPEILLTNPEYLNMSFLGRRESWNPDFLLNLRYVVIDEMHEYRGFFGSNVSLLLRRFFRHLDRIGVTPRVFLSTATCANPQEHARNLTGRDAGVISARDVLRPRRHFIFVKPDIPDFRYRDILQLRVEQAALAALASDIRVLVFCPTKRFIADALISCRRKASDMGLVPEHISEYHADLKGDTRQDIQEKIKSGAIKVVFTTNALELGLDIGGLDGVIMAGFPSNVMSAWQQIGRAGRGWDKDSFVLFYAMNDPIDRFFVGNLDAFLNKPFDELVVDPSNEQLIENHIPSLDQEMEGIGLCPSDEDILGSAFYNAAPKNPVKQPKGFFPQRRIDMRGGIGQSYKLRSGNDELGQVGTMRRFREAYIGAIFPFFGRHYRVHSHESDAVVLVDTEPNLRTEAAFGTTLLDNDLFDGCGYGDIEVLYGSKNIQTRFYGYNLVDERTGQERDSFVSNEALYQNNLHAFWVNAPNSDSAKAGIGAVEHMIRVGAMFVVPADRFDTSTYSQSSNEPAAYCYENYPGGIGVAKKLFEVWDAALAKGMEIACACSCRLGCPDCIEPAKSYNISNAVINKMHGIELATELLAAVKAGPDRRFRNGRMVPV